MNKIPRKFNYIIAESMFEGNVGKGKQFKIVKDEFGHYIGTDMQTEQRWSMFVSHLRNDAYFKILEIA